MKMRFLYLVILVAGFVLVGSSVSQAYGQTAQSKPVKQKVVNYTCPMHPEVIKDKPGKCPKCGMELVEKKDKPKENVHQSKDSTKMKHNTKMMMHDSTNMKKGHMMKDSASMKHHQMDM
jgi:hypothetical protein